MRALQHLASATFRQADLTPADPRDIQSSSDDTVALLTLGTNHPEGSAENGQAL